MFTTEEKANGLFKKYKLNKDDEIIVSDFNYEYLFKVYDISKVNIKNKNILDNVYDKKILTLITCTSNNQIRYVVTAKYIHTIPWNTDSFQLPHNTLKDLQQY